MPFDAALVVEPNQARFQIHVFNIEFEHSLKPDAQKTEQHDDDEISQAKFRIYLADEIIENLVELSGGEKARNFPCDFRIGDFTGEVVIDNFIQLQEMIKMPQRPDAILFDMHGWLAKVGDEGEQMLVGDIGN